MKIVFLHGLESTPETSNTGKYLKSKIPDLLIPDYGPNVNDFEAIKNFFTEYFDEDEDYIVIGISIGGFWSLKLTEFTNVYKIIMINPAITRACERYNTSMNINVEVVGDMILNKDDKIIDNQENYNNYMNRFHISTFENGGHQCTNIDEIFDKIVESIDFMSVWVP